MGIVNRLLNGRDETARRATTDWIDLSDYQPPEGASASGATTVRFAQIRKLDDVQHFAGLVYDGAILVVDIAPVQDDEITLRRLTNDLRKLAQDVGGDIAGLGEHHIMLTPTGIKVDKHKLTVDEDADDGYRPATAPVLRR